MASVRKKWWNFLLILLTLAEFSPHTLKKNILIRSPPIPPPSCSWKRWNRWSSLLIASLRCSLKRARTKGGPANQAQRSTSVRDSCETSTYDWSSFEAQLDPLQASLWVFSFLILQRVSDLLLGSTSQDCLTMEISHETGFICKHLLLSGL